MNDEAITIRIAGSAHTHDPEIKNTGLEDWNVLANDLKTNELLKLANGDSSKIGN